MSLRFKFIAYLTLLHLIFAAVSVYFLWENRIWLLALEALFALSLSAGIWLVRSLFHSLDLLRTGTELLKDRDFGSRFREVGQPEMDQLVQLYNRMADHLREERIRLQEQYYFMNRILEVSPSGIVTFDFDGAVAMANPVAERMLQLPAEKLKGMKLREIDTPFAHSLEELKAGESRVIALRGGRRVKCHRGEFLDRGFPRSFLSMEELTEELRQSEKSAYEKLIRMMSHEVNNSVGAANSLLNACMNYRDQLRPEDRNDFEHALQVVISRTAQLNAFMRDFADVVRLPPPRRRPCDLRALLEGIEVLMQQEFERIGVSWKWEEDEPLPPISMDRVQMEQALVNIVKNALEAMDGGGVLTVSMGLRGERHFLVLRDSGRGIAPDVQAQLFSPFFSTKANGQGIGLTLVKEILLQHGFDFSLEGRPGGPTDFTIYF